MKSSKGEDEVRLWRMKLLTNERERGIILRKGGEGDSGQSAFGDRIGLDELRAWRGLCFGAGDLLVFRALWGAWNRWALFVGVAPCFLFLFAPALCGERPADKPLRADGKPSVFGLCQGDRAFLPFRRVADHGGGGRGAVCDPF